MKHLYLHANTEGRDFIVGDIHGAYGELMTLMHYVKFDETRDRLIAVGDIIDRGPQSMECVFLLLSKSWFYSVKGNHEDLMIQSILKKNSSSTATWMGNGGLWALDQSPDVLEDIANDLNKLPLIISVGEHPDRFNVIHADIFSRASHVSDSDIDNWTFSDMEENYLLWSRNVHSSCRISDYELNKVHSEKLSITYCGHTPVLEPCYVQRQLFIDTGLWTYGERGEFTRNERGITFMDHKNQKYYTYLSTEACVVENDYSTIKQLQPKPSKD